MVPCACGRAIVAVAHETMLRVICVVLRDGMPYGDPSADQEDWRVGRDVSNWPRLLRPHGWRRGGGTRRCTACAAMP